ncbi:MAG: UTP--glucose-1-phosphate uridylyltransferase [Candidatus Muproteobacteria bacterium RBG_16_64_11]|uniref:UTP--glucose-1-phosphate uridylyltransferase n=1 Tax=Candidatus Muproteobacteria bacterium RBG_16_64_11 TaxID=1817758 RepID=A0A1F6TFQ2_9PROT|nr:MAG: UTP--glucose-1-phosphate uridylyltransferase [Candidatus Muproteobacteria bacterium RBG_16_64_11]
MGTRFLPATKANPKEMLPVVDKPLIQYATDEAIAAGINELIFVTGRNKRAIEDHFDKAYELEAELSARNKTELLACLNGILPAHVSCVYTRQPQALGLGHAVLCAKPLVGRDAFAVLLADDLIDGTPPALAQMRALYERHRCSIVAVQKIARTDSASYGMIKGKAVESGLWEMEGIVEKPQPEQAPSELAVTGRYILTPGIFDCLETVTPGAGGEIQLTDGIARLLQQERVLAYEFQGTRYDCGSKLGYLQATVEHGLQHDELRADFRRYLRALKL